MFKAKGGTYRDYLFHGPNNDTTIQGLTFGSAKPQPLLNTPFIVKIAAMDVTSMDFKDIRIVKADAKGARNMAKPIPAELKKGAKIKYVELNYVDPKKDPNW